VLSLRIKYLLIIVFILCTTQPLIRSWNEASRMATVQSIVKKQSFVINESVFIDTGDKVFIDGKFYSDKPAIPSIMGAIVYMPLSFLGLELRYGLNTVYYLIVLFTVKIFWLLGLISFYLVLKEINLAERKRLWLTFALGGASLYLTWSSTFNNHSLAASFLIIGFHFLMKAKVPASARGNIVFAGLFLSLAGAVDMPVSVFFAGFLIYVLTDSALRLKSHLFLFPALIPYLTTMLINYHISGSIIPVQLEKSYFLYPGSPWAEAESIRNLSGITVNRGMFALYYGFTVLFGLKGFFLYNPLLFIAMPFLFREIRSKKKLRKEAIVIAISSIIIVLYYTLFSNNYGGWSYSIRWFVPLLPLLFIFIYPFLENISNMRRKIFAVLVVVSAAIAIVGLINPWTNAGLSDTPFIANIVELLSYF